MRNSFSKVQYLLFALLLFALAGCGAHSLNTAGTAQPGTITAKLVMPKSSAKTVGAAAATPTTVRLIVTGATIPTATQVLTTTSGGSIAVYPGSQLIVTALALDANNNVLFEGFATDVTVTAGNTTIVSIGGPTDPNKMVQPKNNPEDKNCLACHDNTRDATGQNVVANFKQSGHYADGTAFTGFSSGGTYGKTVGCAGCHGPSHNDLSPSANGRCFQCHSNLANQDPQHATANYINSNGTNCADCHNPHNARKVIGGSCVKCHSIAQNANVGSGEPFETPAGSIYVNDNNGVRSITTEFSKWSHHVTGVALNDAHCAACHLEGTISADGSTVKVDTTKHMVDATTHLRNANTDADMQWDPANPNHTTMDNFCMSCHSATGASSPMSVKIQAYINGNQLAATGKTASAINPFGDTISNQYDKMQRPAVVNVDSQFNTTNNSHHGVKGPRYTGRTRLAGSRQMVSPANFTANSSANLPGNRTTIYDANKFNQAYTPLQNAGGEAAPRTGAATLGDDSTLHCGDCHTVGQWKVGSSTIASGASTPAAIGAHGSVNEYLLRNSIGTDARHQGIQMDASAMHADSVTPYLVCYDCHAIANYGLASHIGEQVVGENNCDTPTNTNTVNAIGAARITSQYSMSYGTNVAGTPTGATNGNIYGIQCNNCHNNGISAGNIFGGIHGAADPTYADGAGNTTKHERFLPGLGNVMYAPGTRGGITGGTAAFQSYSSAVQKSGISTGKRFKGSYAYTTGGVTNDTNWEEKSRIPVGDGVTGWSHNPGAAGCYTIASPDEPIVAYNAEGNGVPAGPPASVNLKDPNGGPLTGVWGGCTDHAQQTGSSVRQPRNTNTSIRPITY